MLRVVLDTNIVISGIFWGGLPGQALDAVSELRAQLISSRDLFTELHTTISRTKFAKRVAATGKSIDELLDASTGMAEIVIAVTVPEDAVRDPKDRMVLGCSVGGKADCIVSGDADLLVLVEYEGIPILTVQQFLALLEQIEQE